MKEPVDHILRPQLPWRSEGAITECGLNAASVRTLTRPEYFARLKDMGQQRSALMTCMTCAETARRWKTWEEEPREAMQREVEWETRWRRSEKSGCRLLDELTAIASLIEAHPEEFETLKLAVVQRREWVEQKVALKTKARQSK